MRPVVYNFLQYNIQAYRAGHFCKNNFFAKGHGINYVLKEIVLIFKDKTQERILNGDDKKAKKRERKEEREKYFTNVVVGGRDIGENIYPLVWLC